jgi:hypothetical protein
VLEQGSSIRHVVVTGHSMGAGVSTLLSYTIQVGAAGWLWTGGGQGNGLDRLRVLCLSCVACGCHCTGQLWACWVLLLTPTCADCLGVHVCFLQAYLDKAKSSVDVDAMLFAPPNVGDMAFAEAYGAAVNARRYAGPGVLWGAPACDKLVAACAVGCQPPCCSLS